MIRVSIQVACGAACFTIAVQSETLLRAVSLAKERYPGGDICVVFPIAPEEFFVGNGETLKIEVEVPKEVTG